MKKNATRTTVISRSRGRTVEEARLKARTDVAPGWTLDEVVECDGQPEMVEATGETVAAARDAARARVPEGVTATDEVVREAGQRDESCEAADEESARIQIQRRCATHETVGDLQASGHGHRTGSLHLGRRVIPYRATVRWAACVRTSYRRPARVRFTRRRMGMFEAQREGVSAVAAVLAAGAKVDERDEGGYTPLNMAAVDGDQNLVRLLADHGAKVNAATEWGATALSGAARKGDLGMVDLLLSLGANVNVAEYDGYTPLMRAVMDRHSEVVRRLLAAGASTAGRQKHGYTAGDLAVAANWHHEFARLVQERDDVLTSRVDATAIANERLGIRFDVDKIDAGDYGSACWKVLWASTDPDQLSGALLYEGDTSASAAGRENVFSIAIRANPAALRHVRAALERSADFIRIAADPPFVEGTAAHSEPLVEAGRVEGAHVVGGISGTASSALMSARDHTEPISD